MKKRTLIIVLAIWIALVPVLGFPNAWKNRIVTVSAICVAWLAYSRPSKKLSIEQAESDVNKISR